MSQDAPPCSRRVVTPASDQRLWGRSRVLKLTRRYLPFLGVRIHPPGLSHSLSDVFERGATLVAIGDRATPDPVTPPVFPPTRVSVCAIIAPIVASKPVEVLDLSAVGPTVSNVSSAEKPTPESRLAALTEARPPPRRPPSSGGTVENGPLARPRRQPSSGARPAMECGNTFPIPAAFPGSASRARSVRQIFQGSRLALSFRRVPSMKSPGLDGCGERPRVTTPRASSNQVTTSPPWPARPIALRGFSDSATTREPGFCARSSSARVGARSRVALLPSFAGRPYVITGDASSSVQPRERRSSRCHQSFSTIRGSEIGAVPQ